MTRQAAVQSVAVKPLLAMLNIEPAAAMAGFCVMMIAHPELLGTHYVEKFLEYAGYKDYPAIRPVVLLMMADPEPKVAIAGARKACFHGFDGPTAGEDAAYAHSGSAILRKGAAQVYAQNVANRKVGAACRDFLDSLLADPEDEVRRQALTCFNHLGELTSLQQAQLLKAFLAGNPSSGSIRLVLHFIEKSPVQLPSLLLELAHRCMSVGDDPLDQSSDFGTTSELSKVVVRLLTLAENSEIQRECLDLIDEMERRQFYGVTLELLQADR